MIKKARNNTELNYLKIFGKNFPEDLNFEYINAKKFYDKRPKVKVNGRILAMEIIKKNMQVMDPVMPLYMLFTLVGAAIPYILHAIFTDHLRFFYT